MHPLILKTGQNLSHIQRSTQGREGPTCAKRALKSGEPPWAEKVVVNPLSASAGGELFWSTWRNCVLLDMQQKFSRRGFYTSPPSQKHLRSSKRLWKVKLKVQMKSLSCIFLCDSTDCRPPDFSVRGAFQARVLEWVAISFSRGSPHPGMEPRSPAVQADASPSEPPGRPLKRLDPECQHSEWEGEEPNPLIVWTT